MIAEFDVAPNTTWFCDWCGKRLVVQYEGIPVGWNVYPVDEHHRFPQHQCDACRPFGYGGQPSERDLDPSGEGRGDHDQVPAL